MFGEILGMLGISSLQSISMAAVDICLLWAFIKTAKHIIHLFRCRNTGNRLRTSPARDPSYRDMGTSVYFTPERYGLTDNKYKFNYVRKDGSWRAYIVRMPDLNGRADSGSITHRLRDGDRYYVCWNCPVMTLNDIKAISHVWADGIQKYIATGQHFG